MREGISYSNPGERIRHSFPLAERETGYRAGIEIARRASPALLSLFKLHMGYVVGCTVSLPLSVVLALSGQSQGSSQSLIFLGLLFGLMLPCALYLSWYRRRMVEGLGQSYLVAISRMITHGSMGNQEQATVCDETLDRLFGSSQAAGAMHRELSTCAAEVIRESSWLSERFQFAGFEGVLPTVYKLLEQCSRLIADAIFAYIVARNDRKISESASDGLFYFAQNWEPMVNMAVSVFIFEWSITIGLALVFLLPATICGMLMPDAVGGWVYLLAVIGALAFREAVIHPWVSAVAALAFLTTVHKQELDAQAVPEFISKCDALREMVSAGASAQV